LDVTIRCVEACKAVRPFVLSALIAVAVSCANGGRPPASEAPSEASPARVDLIEAGIRAVVSPSPHTKVVYVQTRLCRGMGGSHCVDTLSDEEIAALGERLADLAPEVRFVPDYEGIPDGEAPIDAPGREFVVVGPPEAQDDGTYRIEAGETCGGLCGHGGTFVLENEAGTWTSTGNAPGTGQWVS
jgi:hypothetical protein